MIQDAAKSASTNTAISWNNLFYHEIPPVIYKVCLYVRDKLYNFFIFISKWHKLEYLVCKSRANSTGHVDKNIYLKENYNLKKCLRICL